MKMWTTFSAPESSKCQAHFRRWATLICDSPTIWVEQQLQLASRLPLQGWWHPDPATLRTRVNFEVCVKMGALAHANSLLAYVPGLLKAKRFPRAPIEAYRQMLDLIHWDVRGRALPIWGPRWHIGGSWRTTQSCCVYTEEPLTDGVCPRGPSIPDHSASHRGRWFVLLSWDWWRHLAKHVNALQLPWGGETHFRSLSALLELGKWLFWCV